MCLNFFAGLQIVRQNHYHALLSGMRQHALQIVVQAVSSIEGRGELLKDMEFLGAEHLYSIAKSMEDTDISGKTAHIYVFNAHLCNNGLQMLYSFSALKERIFLNARALPFAEYIYKSACSMKRLEKFGPDGCSRTVGKAMLGPLAAVSAERAMSIGVKITGNDFGFIVAIVCGNIGSQGVHGGLRSGHGQRAADEIYLRVNNEQKSVHTSLL